MGVTDEYGTVADHVAAGDIVPRRRVTAEDLELAATWLEAYEGTADDDTLHVMAAVAARLRADAARRYARRPTGR